MSDYCLTSKSFIAASNYLFLLCDSYHSTPLAFELFEALSEAMDDDPAFEYFWHLNMGLS